MARRKEYSIEEAVRVLWEDGDRALAYLHKAQEEMHQAFQGSSARKFVINCSRRLGKSFYLCALADYQARKQPGSQIRYAAPTAKAVRKIVKPLFKKIWEDCPKELKPRWNSLDQCYVYPNGSEIHIAGTDQGNAENLRGSEAVLAIVDEAGFCDDLEYLINDILMPQTLTTNGRILIASTPPKTPGHEFQKIYLEARTRGAYIERTIYANPLITAETIREYMEESGGADSTTWRREYLAQFVTDEDTAIVPEFTEEKAEVLVKAVPRPDHFDCYVAMDVGFEDLTFIIFGYWDFKTGCGVIEDEVVLQGSEVRTDVISSVVANKEYELWASKPPYMRVSDTEPILLNELNVNHGMLFNVTRKDDKYAAVNNLRLLVRQNRLFINPRCENLITHLRYGVWDKNKKKFARTKSHGHFDGVDALVYWVRNVKPDKNPYPTPTHDAYTEHWVPGPVRLKTTAQTFKDIMSGFSVKE